MKKSILTLILAALVFGVGAETVTPEMARLAADAWAARNAAFGAGVSATDVRAEYDPADAGRVLWYQVSMTGGGCLMIAPDTTIEPVICALDNDPGVLPAAHPLRGILVADMRARLAFLAKDTTATSSSTSTAGSIFGTRGGAVSGGLTLSAVEDEDSPAAVAHQWGEDQKNKWLRLGVGGARKSGLKLAEAPTVGVTDEAISLVIGIVDGFEKNGRFTHWNQAGAGEQLTCFNRFTPSNSVCGCVATATSAILQFFGATGFQLAEGAEEPGAGCTYNGKKYADVFGEPAAILEPDEAYDWSILPSNWGGEAEESAKLTPEQADLLGRVAYNAGVCHDMMWTDGESGAFTTDTAKVLRDYFGFTEARCVTKITQDQYRKLIYMQNWAGAPVGMGIEGHAVVAVGYGRDSQGVERVRVFMGWGGSGDGWYALPYIDTKATMNGGTYLSTVVNSITTMISLEDDKVVPVCVQLLPSLNAPVTVTDEITVSSETKNANNKGFCGIRMSAELMTKEKNLIVTCSKGTDEAEGEGAETQPTVEEKSWTVTVPGADPKKANRANRYTESAASLCDWIPDALLLPLVKVESAATFEDAKIQALASTPPRPILAMSGTWGDETTDAAWRVIQELDEGATSIHYLDDEGQDHEIPYAGGGDFSNRFVLVCLPYTPGDKVSDGNPSVALFNPAALDVDNRWAFYNGRLAYWSVYGRQYTANTDPENGVTVEELYNPTNKAANRWISLADIRTNVMNVINATTNLGLIQASISVTSTSDTPETIRTGENEYCFEAVNQFSAGELIFTAPEVITNAANTIVYECVGWTVSNLTAHVEVAACANTSDPQTAVFEAEENNSYLVLWQWQPILYKITVTPWLDMNGGRTFPADYAKDLLNVFEQWCQPGDQLVIRAQMDCPYKTARFRDWKYDEQSLEKWLQNPKKVCGAVAHEEGPLLTFTAGRYPLSIRARYAPGTDVKSVAGDNKCVLVIKSSGADVEVSPTIWAGEELVSGQSYGNWSMAVRLEGAPCIRSDADGVEWICTNWTFTTKNGAVEQGQDWRGVAAITLQAGTAAAPCTNTLTWVWTRYQAPALAETYDIQWDVTWAGAEGITTNLMTSAELMLSGMTLEDLAARVTAPPGWEVTLVDDGRQVMAVLNPTAELDEAAITVTSTTDTPGTEKTAYCFTAVNQFAVNEEGNVLTFTAPEVLTNAANNIEYACAGWTVSNLTTHAEVATNGKNDRVVATFAVDAQTEYLIVWHWTPTRYKIVFKPWLLENGGRDFPEAYANLVDVREQWCQPGEQVVVTAQMESDYRNARFSEWAYDERRYAVWMKNPALVCGAQADEDDLRLTFTVGNYPTVIHARYQVVSATRVREEEQRCFLKIESTGADVDVPPTVWSGRTYALGSVTAMGDWHLTSIRLEGAPYHSTDAEGCEWICTNWTFTAQGETSEGCDPTGRADIMLKAGTVAEPCVNTLTWVWTPYEAPPPPEVEEAYVIDWDDALENLSGGFTTNLVTASALEEAGLSVEEFAARVHAPYGWRVQVTCAGEDIVATLTADEEAMAASMATVQMNIVARADGALKVFADVPEGIRGFWYAIYGADDLAGDWSLVAEGAYESGSPVEQVTTADLETGTGSLTVEIVVRPDTPRQFYKARVSDKKPEL